MGVLPLGRIPVQPGQSLLVEPGAMEAYAGLKMETGVHTSIAKAFGRVFGGETFFVNKFFASPEKAGWIALEESTPGQIAVHMLQPGERILMKKGAFVASDTNVEVSVGSTGFHGFFSRIGFVVLEAKVNGPNPGRIFFGSGQGVTKVLDVDGSVVVDNNNIIAYTGNLSLDTVVPGGGFSPMGAISLACGGEGIATQFTGKGKVYLGSPKPQSTEAIKRAEDAAFRAEQAALRTMSAASKTFEIGRQVF